MAQATLTNSASTMVSDRDSVVIVRSNFTIPGGRTLDVTGFTPDTIEAGHIIIRDTASGELKPMPLNGGATAYASLPASHEYAGVLAATILKAKPLAAICIDGVVNPSAMPFSVSGIQGAIKTAIPTLIFQAD